MTNEIEGAMPPLPEPFGHIHDGNGNQPLSFDRGPIPWERSIGCSTQEVYSFAQLKAYAAPLIARVAELQADAERYRWLKERNGGPIGIVAWHRDEEKEMVLVDEHADQAIDAARSRKE